MSSSPAATRPGPNGRRRKTKEAGQDNTPASDPAPQVVLDSELASLDPASKTNFRQRRLSIGSSAQIDLSALSEVMTSDETAAPPEQPKKSAPRKRRSSFSTEMSALESLTLSTLAFSPEVVGTFSCHGLSPSEEEGAPSTGVAKTNQDRGSVSYPFGMASPEGTAYRQAFFCVYDGHGPNGDQVSQFVVNFVQDKLDKHPSLHANPMKALKETFTKAHAALKTHKTIDARISGTTAIGVLYRETPTGAKIWTACTGDSRAVLGVRDAQGNVRAEDLSVDQKPDTPAEMKRINAAGGFVTPPEFDGGPARVYVDPGHTVCPPAPIRECSRAYQRATGLQPSPA